jgi:hypothetical protein
MDDSKDISEIDSVLFSSARLNRWAERRKASGIPLCPAERETVTKVLADLRNACSHLMKLKNSE